MSKNPTATSSDLEAIEGALLDVLSVCQDYRRVGAVAELVDALENIADELRDNIDELAIDEGTTDGQ